MVIWGRGQEGNENSTSEMCLGEKSMIQKHVPLIEEELISH